MSSYNHKAESRQKNKFSNVPLNPTYISDSKNKGDDFSSPLWLPRLDSNQQPTG